MRRSLFAAILFLGVVGAAAVSWQLKRSNRSHDDHHDNALPAGIGMTDDSYKTNPPPTLQGTVGASHTPVATNAGPLHVTAIGPEILPDAESRARDARLQLRRRLPQIAANEAALCFADREDAEQIRGEIAVQFQLTAQEGSARFGAIRLTATSLPQPLSECVIGRLSQLRLDPVAIGTFTDTPVELRWTADELRQKAAAWSESAAGE